MIGSMFDKILNLFRSGPSVPDFIVGVGLEDGIRISLMNSSRNSTSTARSLERVVR